MKFKILALLTLGASLLACAPSEDTTQSKPIQEQIQSQNPMPEPGLTAIPMSDSHENGRYFLTSQTTENGLEHVEYIRKGNDSDSYTKMEINCSKNQLRKYSADNVAALQSADMGNWVTPDWTDEDIFNFICK